MKNQKHASHGFRQIAQSAKSEIFIFFAILVFVASLPLFILHSARVFMVVVIASVFDMISWPKK